MSKPVERKWSSYRREVVPAQAPPVQVTECERAFYAGAHAVLELLIQQIDPSGDVTESDIALVESVTQDVQTYVDQVRRRAGGGT